ncbi:MAG: hypothetical protein ACMUHU_07715 [Thermoplasmatota archaeon]
MVIRKRGSSRVEDDMRLHEEIALDTSERVSELMEFLLSRGYQEVGTVHREGTNYNSVLISLEL